jgi:hypothetical protein
VILACIQLGFDPIMFSAATGTEPSI